MSAVQTRAQRDLGLALELVLAVEQAHPDPSPQSTKGRYQALCQNFPVMVRTMGLAQALAFAEAKKGEEKGLPQAYGLLLEHVARVLELPPGQLLNTVKTDHAGQYMHRTRRVLEAWVFFKRMAESQLEVQKEGKDAQPPTP
ncbi:MAG: type III-B CRISPR module-associated protein Cmr5 [Meiothermus sp.]